MGYKWLPVTEDFDKTLVIKKWRFDVSIPISNNYDGALSELPNIDIKTCWNNPQPSNGYAFSNRFNLGKKYFSSRYYGWTNKSWTATTEAHTTLVSGTTYEFECPVDLYWAGNYSTPWNTNIPNYMWFYVQSSTFETDVTAITATYSATTSSVTLTAEEDMTWTASTNDSWITVSPASGTGSATITISVSQNKTYISRTGSVEITNGEDTIEITVEQEKYPLFIPSENIYRADLEVVKAYRSGNAINKAYRSGELIYLRLETGSQPQPVTEPMLIHNATPITGDYANPTDITVASTDTSTSFDVEMADQNTPWAISDGMSVLASGTGSTSNVSCTIYPTNPEFMSTIFHLQYKKDGDGDSSWQWTGEASYFQFTTE